MINKFYLMSIHDLLLCFNFFKDYLLKLLYN